MLILLGSLLFLLIPIIYLVSLFKPKTFGIRTAKNPDGKLSRGKFTLYTLIAWVISFVIIGSGLDETESTENTAQAPEYEVLKDEVDGRIKRTVEVELSSRTDEELLEGIAEEIYDLSKKKVERTFIGYWIAGEDNTQGYWATTHYNPDLDVKIMGLSGSDYDELVNTKAQVDGEIVGTWMINRGALEYKAVAYKKDGDDSMYLVDQHVSGSTEQAYKTTETDDGLKLVDAEGEGSDFGEYLVINNDGELEFWSENGNFYTAKPLK